jgi:carotenoid cleavage dioxygenase-like enzyme
MAASPYVTYHRANASGELIIDRGVDVPKLTMVHDFALSADHMVLMDLPIVFRLDIARNSPRDLPYRWNDDYGAGSEYCAAMTHTVRYVGLTSLRVTFFTSSTPLIRPRMMDRSLQPLTDSVICGF